VASVYQTDGANYGTSALAGNTAAWTNTFRIQTSDGNEALAYGFASGAYSDYIYVIGHNFAAVPSGATITGVAVTINRRGANFKDYVIKLLKAGTISGTDHADTATNYPGTAASVTYGADGDMWGLSLTDTDVKASNFGVALAVQQTASGYNEAYVDYMGIRVYYSTGGGTVYSYGFWTSFGRPLQHQEGY
jgi:hypothetical protein